MGKANSFRRALHRVYEDGAELTRHPRSSRITLVLYRRRAFTTKLEVRRAMWRAFDTAVRRKPLAGAADAVYGNSIQFRLEIIARSRVQVKNSYLCFLM